MGPSPRRGATFDQRSSTKSFQAELVSPEELRREDGATCARFGFHPGTDAFASCLQKESLARRYWDALPPPYWGGGYWGSGWGPYWP
jgi:hypothetical protein